MGKYSITEVKDANQINPNVIYNRFDLFEGEHNYKIFHYTDENLDFSFEVLFSRYSAKLGIWLMNIDQTTLRNITAFIFKYNRKIRYVQYENSYISIGTAQQGNHFRIELPGNIEELDKRLSSKGRYNIRREKRILEQDFEEFSIHRCSAVSAEAEVLWDMYFKFKEKTHDHSYDMSPDQYCYHFHVTDIYSLCVGAEKRVIALILSCEQCPVVYIENLSYDLDYARYSPGQVLYDEYLKMLIANDVKEIFLLGGDYDYKRRYGSIEETIYTGSVHRYEFIKRIWKKIRQIGQGNKKQ